MGYSFAVNEGAFDLKICNRLPRPKAVTCIQPLKFEKVMSTGVEQFLPDGFQVLQSIIKT